MPFRKGYQWAIFFNITQSTYLISSYPYRYCVMSPKPCRAWRNLKGWSLSSLFTCKQLPEKTLDFVRSWGWLSPAEISPYSVKTTEALRTTQHPLVRRENDPWLCHAAGPEAPLSAALPCFYYLQVTLGHPRGASWGTQPSILTYTKCWRRHR